MFVVRIIRVQKYTWYKVPVQKYYIPFLMTSRSFEQEKSRHAIKHTC